MMRERAVEQLLEKLSKRATHGHLGEDSVGIRGFRGSRIVCVMRREEPGLLSGLTCWA